MLPHEQVNTTYIITRTTNFSIKSKIDPNDPDSDIDLNDVDDDDEEDEDEDLWNMLGFITSI